MNEKVFRLSAPLHKALSRPVEPIRALVSGEAEYCWRSTMAVQALRKREVLGSNPAVSTNFEGANRASPARACPHSSTGRASGLYLERCTFNSMLRAPNSFPSFMRQDTTLVRRRGKFETFGEHHFFCVGSPTGRRRFPQKEDRQANGSRSAVVMSDVEDSGRQIGHGNIDANDPELPLRRAREAGGFPLPVAFFTLRGEG